MGSKAEGTRPSAARPPVSCQSLTSHLIFLAKIQEIIWAFKFYLES